MYKSVQDIHRDLISLLTRFYEQSETCSVVLQLLFGKLMQHIHIETWKQGITIYEAKKKYLFSLLTGSERQPVSSFQNGFMKEKFFR